LAAAAKDSSGTTLSGQTVTWTSSATAIATVSASGLVTGVAAGSATITATSGGKSGTAAVTVTAPAPPPAPLVIAVGGRVQAGSTGANIRSGPAGSTSLVGAQPAGALGTVVAGPVVDATGDGLTRWQVDSDTRPDG